MPHEAATGSGSASLKTIFNPTVRRDREARRFSMSARKYLEKHHVIKYLQDAVGLMIESRAEKPVEYLAEYFRTVLQGSNVVRRRFGYANQTPRNRQSFVRQFYEAYSGFGDDDELTIEGFHQLLTLLCRDFPYSMVRNASRITMEVKDLPSRVRFKAFSLKVFVLFFFSEFMNQSALAFRTIDKKATGKVRVSQFMNKIRGILDKDPNYSYPSLAVLQEVLGTSSAGVDPDREVMFNEFCVKLFNHPRMESALNYQPPYEVVKAGLGRLFRAMTDAKASVKAPSGKSGGKRARSAAAASADGAASSTAASDSAAERAVDS